jgi:CheY-like chemotaxis protein
VTKEGLAVVRIELPQKVIKNEPVGDFRARYEEFIHASEKKAEHFVAPNASILAIDEVPMNLRVMSGLVKESCAQFESVSNGMEAIECFRNHHYDIVFLDNTMPIIDGLDILTIMKTLRNHPNENTPIIMLTAEDNASAKNICESLGYTDFLTKPVHEQALSSILLKYLPQEKMTWYGEPVKKDAEKRRNTAAARASEPARENASESAALDTPAIEQVLPEDLRALSMTGAVNVAVGLYCCERNEALYRKRLMNYMDEHYEATLAQFFKEEDFENYRLSVQSLKSASLYIGAINIASIAKTLEYACNEGNYDLVHIRHNELMNGYRQLIKILKEQQKNGRAN